MGASPTPPEPFDWAVDEAREIQKRLKAFDAAQERLLRAKSSWELVNAADDFKRTGQAVAGLVHREPTGGEVPPALQPFLAPTDQRAPDLEEGEQGGC